MDEILGLIIGHLEKVGFGAVLFLMAYISNMGLGAWKNVKIEGYDFDWFVIGQSALKFVVLGASIAILSMVVSIVPAYATYVGIEIGIETLETIDAIVIIGAFLTATIRYVMDAVSKLKAILGIGK